MNRETGKGSPSTMGRRPAQCRATGGRLGLNSRRHFELLLGILAWLQCVADEPALRLRDLGFVIQHSDAAFIVGR